MKKELWVAVGVIYRQGQVCIAKRHSNQHQGGLWEFPGGKVESGETAVSALVRELQEELGIDVDITETMPQPLIEVVHQYPDKKVRLDTFVIEHFSGEPKGMEQQPVQWVAVKDLNTYAFPDANVAIVNAVITTLG